MMAAAEEKPVWFGEPGKDGANEYAPILLCTKRLLGFTILRTTRSFSETAEIALPILYPALDIVCTFPLTATTDSY